MNIETIKNVLIVLATIGVICLVRFTPSPPPMPTEAELYEAPVDPEDIYGSY